MKFIPVRELRNNTGKVWETLRTERELVLTANGQPIALMTPVTGENLENQIKAMRRAKASLILEHLRHSAQKNGLDKMPMSEIEKIIGEVRRERRKAGSKTKLNRGKS
ncbi:MAG: type II toxin-antitoxin system Phd/YefM family antitoxin [bacterium]